jgi:succinate dehydrogenase/fumarate reductase flavoprotein subunit
LATSVNGLPIKRSLAQNNTKEKIMTVNVPSKWDAEYDVVVVGYGGAGAAAAMTAHDSGAKVMILEKTSSGGGNTRVSGGNTIVPQSMQFVKYLNTLNFGMTDPDYTETFVKMAMTNADWIKEIGGETTVFRPLGVAYPMPAAGAGFPQVEGAEYMIKVNIKGDPEITPAQRLWSLLSGNVDKRCIKTMLNTAVKELVQDASGQILGVIAEADGKVITICARKAVILTCGGFENDDTLKWQHLPCKPTLFIGHPGNTGDGIRMAEKVGAQIWHMQGQTVVIGFKAPNIEAAFFIIFLNPGFFYIDKYGKRFLGESEVETHEFWRSLSEFDTHRIEYPRIPFYAIFDDQTRKTGPIGGGTAGHNPKFVYKWSLDNQEEIKKGWIIQAKSIAELAEKISVDPNVLEDTVKRWNENCSKGVDPDFGRKKENIRALEGNRYYAIKLWPAILNTGGGPRRDKEARIIDAFGKPIPRLYSSGELGSAWGMLYQGANSIGESIVFGKIAGKNAAAEKPWA